jgi:hypothetical protein
MKRTNILLINSLLLATLGFGCGNSNTKGGNDSEKLGQLAFPLVTNGPSGTKYQLRNAVFEISPYNNYYYGGVGGAANYATGGAANTPSTGTDPSNPTVIVNSDDYPDSDSIQVDISEGYYSIYLRPGWQLQSVVNGVAQDVNATLLSPDYQWVSVYRHSTSWVSFQFGLGDRDIWFNGSLNIQVSVYENPDQLYPGTGGAQSWNTGGSAPTGGAYTVSTGGAVNY